ncbi:MAG: GAF domain-containing protein [Nitrospira sp.]|nr:MAG: GAF domain-containing protein [Nitrospira sp.]
MATPDPMIHMPATISEDFHDGIPAPLSPRDLLTRWLGALTRLVRARYGALGVMNEAGTVTDFISTGFCEAENARIAEFLARPEVTGTMLRSRRPIRLIDLMQELRSSGCPPDDPPMGSFLGIPIAGREVIVGLVYLVEKEIPGGFTPTDELVAGMAVDALALTLDHSRLFQQPTAHRDRTEEEAR